jgi:DNA-binding CsgD family transcriptional regulator
VNSKLYDTDTLQTVSNWLLDLQKLSVTTELAVFPKTVMDSLKPIIPHQAAFWGGGRAPVGATVLHYVYLVDLDVASLAAWEKCKHLMGEAVGLQAANQRKSVIYSKAFPPDHPVFTQMFHPFGINDVMSVYQFDPQLGIYHVTSLYRNDGTCFTETEGGIFQALAPHLVSALRACKIANIKRLNESPLINLGAKAIVDTEGVIHVAEDQLIALLQTEWPNWQAPWIPLDVWHKLSKNNAPHPFIGKRIVLALEGNEDLRLLTARPKLAIDELSKREHEVAKYYASGRSHKEIAQHLNIAAGTVRNQLNMVYAKLGVNDKGALAAYLSQF